MRLEVENRAMKEELVRSKSKISSLEREMSSIHQLHLAKCAHPHVTTSTTMTLSVDSHRLDDQDQSIVDPFTHYLPNNQGVVDFSPYSVLHVDLCNEASHSANVSPANNSCATQTSSLTLTNVSDQPMARSSTNPVPSSVSIDSNPSLSDEQLRVYLAETLQREKDSSV
jgi:hypothetical protein